MSTRVSQPKRLDAALPSRRARAVQPLRDWTVR